LAAEEFLLSTCETTQSLRFEFTATMHKQTEPCRNNKLKKKKRNPPEDKNNEEKGEQSKLDR